MSRQIVNLMMKSYHAIVFFLCLVIFPLLLHSQNLIIDPPSISFQKGEGTTIYNANTSVLVKVISDVPWEVTCRRESGNRPEGR